jgi:hypothetical protein
MSNSVMPTIHFRCIFIWITLCFCIQSQAQNFFKYGYKDATFSQGISQITATNDGGIISTGITYSWDTAVNGITIVKYSSSGLVQWQKIIALKGNVAGSNTVVETSDGNYFITALSYDNFYTILLKLDGLGNILFSKIIRNFYLTGIFNSADCIVPDNNGVILAGVDTINLNLTVVHLDESGNLTWAHTYTSDPFIDQTVIKIVGDSENNLYVISNQNSSPKLQVLKMTNAGSTIWYKEISRNDSISLTLSNAHCVNSIDSKVVISGGTEQDWTFVLALDTSGNSVYAKTYTGDFYYPFMLSSGNVSGYNYFSFGRIILVTDNMGQSVDNLSFTASSENCYYRFVEPLQDNKLILAGIYLEHEDSAAQSLLTKVDFLKIGGCGIQKHIAEDSPIEVSVVPSQISFSNPTIILEDLYLISSNLNLTRNIICTPYTLQIDADETAFIIVPNPVDNTLYLELISPDFVGAEYLITDVSGRLLKKGKLEERICEIDLQGISKGIYFMKVFSGSDHETVKKFIKR